MAVAMSEDSHGRRNAPKKRDKASVPQQRATADYINKKDRANRNPNTITAIGKAGYKGVHGKRGNKEQGFPDSG